MGENCLTLFRRNVLRLGDQPCFLFKKNQKWSSLSWNEAQDYVRELALGLSELGVGRETPVALLSQTRVEWTLCDLAVLANRAVAIPIYPTLAPEQIAYILKDSKTEVLIVENISLWESIAPYLSSLSLHVVLIEKGDGKFPDLEMLRLNGKKRVPNIYDEKIRQIDGDDIASIVYTSGTTGLPKGAILTHRNFTAEVEGLQEVFTFEAHHIGLMTLPLAHVISRAMQFYQLAQGCQAAYAEGLDKVGENLKEIRPHFMAAVPRLLEKSHEKILAKVGRTSSFLRKIFFWGVGVGVDRSQKIQKKIPLSFLLNLRYFLAQRLILNRIRKNFGGRLSHMICGGAPLPKDLGFFFHAVGILVLEGYGLTETFAAITLNRGDDFRFGSVGKPLSGVRMKIAPDGEICVKGDNVFRGYWGLPAETKQVFDSEGWFLTGDIGDFTKDGFLRITDRKKDIIATSGGKKIAPQLIENLLQQSPYLQNVMVYGDGQKYLTALVTLQWEAVEQYAQQQSIQCGSHGELAQNPLIKKLVEQEIGQMNQKLSSFETIKKFAILEHNFTIEEGELTPTLKVKRKFVTEKYKTVLDRLYL